jgi:hypothetical protein
VQAPGFEGHAEKIQRIMDNVLSTNARTTGTDCNMQARDIYV